MNDSMSHSETQGAFPLQICAKLWRYFINADKKYFEMTAFPLINVMRLKRNLLPLAISHGNGFW